MAFDLAAGILKEKLARLSLSEECCRSWLASESLKVIFGLTKAALIEFITYPENFPLSSS